MMSLRSVSSAGAAPRAAGEAMRNAEPRARLRRARAALLSALVSIAVPAVPAGPLHAEPLPRAHAADKAGEGAGAGKQTRRERSPASPAGEEAEHARRTETRERPRRGEGGDEKKTSGDEKKTTSGAASRKGRARGKAPHAAESAAGNETGAGKETGAAKAGKAKRKEKKRAARTVESKRRATKKGVSREAPPKPCLGPTLSIDRSGIEPERLELVDCAGKPREAARRALSLLARPWGTPRPVLPDERAPARKAEAASHERRTARKAADKREAARDRPAGAQVGEVAPGVRLLDPGLLSRIDALARQYPGRLVSLVSGYRPQSQGSLHQTGRALDLRIAGVRNDELAAACRKLVDTGCGYYPNSSFVHIDVRAPGTGSVSWIDASGPGEVPRYVTAWPPPQEEQRAATNGVSSEDAEEVLRRERREQPAAAERAAGAEAEKTAGAAPVTAANAVLEKVASAVPEKAASAVPEKTTGAVPEKTTGAAPEKTTGAAPEKTTGAAPEKAASAAPKKAAGGAL
ncbi:YcbK family protein [Sorangium sp. So ce1099]|uniref:YcbK family protein n=1 Tax=Sorangium sp. So ce1099 TaxID=3133331 RepID=UPI003F5E40EE